MQDTGFDVPRPTETEAAEMSRVAEIVQVYLPDFPVEEGVLRVSTDGFGGAGSRGASKGPFRYGFTGEEVAVSLNGQVMPDVSTLLVNEYQMGMSMVAAGLQKQLEQRFESEGANLLVVELPEKNGFREKLKTNVAAKPLEGSSMEENGLVQALLSEGLAMYRTEFNESQYELPFEVYVVEGEDKGWLLAMPSWTLGKALDKDAVDWQAYTRRMEEGREAVVDKDAGSEVEREVDAINEKKPVELDKHTPEVRHMMEHDWEERQGPGKVSYRKRWHRHAGQGGNAESRSKARKQSEHMNSTDADLNARREGVGELEIAEGVGDFENEREDESAEKYRARLLDRKNRQEEEERDNFVRDSGDILPDNFSGRPPKRNKPRVKRVAFAEGDGRVVEDVTNQELTPEKKAENLLRIVRWDEEGRVEVQEVWTGLIVRLRDLEPEAVRRLFRTASGNPSEKLVPFEREAVQLGDAMVHFEVEMDEGSHDFRGKWGQVSGKVFLVDNETGKRTDTFGVSFASEWHSKRADLTFDGPAQAVEDVTVALRVACKDAWEAKEEHYHGKSHR